MILIIVKFGELLFGISPRLINALRSYISRTLIEIVFHPISKRLEVGWLDMDETSHSSSCLIYYDETLTF